jgi:NADPH-dependent glutamate synthase beta subunit-like oxidoreductase
MVADLAVDLDPRGTVKADTASYRTSLEKVFACGDMRRGPSPAVWAMRRVANIYCSGVLLLLTPNGSRAWIGSPARASPGRSWHWGSSQAPLSRNSPVMWTSVVIGKESGLQLRPASTAAPS